MITKDKPLISVIVPCYNQGEYVSETLLSVQRQTFSDFECIIVNDGSTDNSLVEIEKFCREDARFSFYDKKNEGVSVARNYGIAHSNGQYILPLDADDVIAPEYLQATVDVLRANPQIKLVYTDTCFFGKRKGKQMLPPYSFERMLCKNLINCTALYRRCDFDKTTGYNPNMSSGLEDWDFWLSLLSPSDKVYKIDKELFFYRIKGRSRNVNATINLSSLRKQLWSNHNNYYGPYFVDPQQCVEYEQISQSREYMLGKFLLKPIRATYELFSKLLSIY